MLHFSHFTIYNQDEICFFDSILTNNGCVEGFVDCRSNEAGQVFGVVMMLWRSFKILRYLTLHIFKTIVLSTLLYGRET